MARRQQSAIQPIAAGPCLIAELQHDAIELRAQSIQPLADFPGFVGNLPPVKGLIAAWQRDRHSNGVLVHIQSYISRIPVRVAHHNPCGFRLLCNGFYDILFHDLSSSMWLCVGSIVPIPNITHVR